MRICAYVQQSYTKQTYKKECMDTRQFVGLRVIIDCLERAGYTVEFAGMDTVHRYDLILVSLTSDCDWWPYVQERTQWQRGNYKVIIGGAGLLHITPFLPFADYFMFGRGEDLIVPLVRGIERDGGFAHESIAFRGTFSPDGIYQIAQARAPYPHRIRLSERRSFCEGPIGCNHKCLFCGYTWHRRFCSEYDHYQMEDSLFGPVSDRERAMLDLHDNPESIDFAHLRTTAIDGMSERLRRMVGKPITREIMLEFLRAMITYRGAPHQLKFYNIVGYPTETESDWMEFVDTLAEADGDAPQREKQWSIVLHSTPFRPMPATPLACAPMSYRNYRGQIGKTLGPQLKGNLIYQGRSLWAVESMGTESLSTVFLSAIAHRGAESDTENIIRLCRTRKFWSAPSPVRLATLEKYFDASRLFGAFTADTLPSRYLRTYAKVEKMWPIKEVTADAR